MVSRGVTPWSLSSNSHQQTKTETKYSGQYFPKPGRQPKPHKQHTFHSAACPLKSGLKFVLRAERGVMNIKREER